MPDADAPMSPTARYCLICCMGERPACGVIRLIAVRRRSSSRTRQGRGTSPIAAIAIAVSWTRPSGQRTAPSPRAKVEHPIGVIKRVFGFVKVRYRGLAKNTYRLVVTCALANLFMARRHLLRCQQL
jgi:IS5 family transposase